MNSRGGPPGNDIDRAAVFVVRDPRFPSGGLERWVEMLAARLPDFGVDVTVLVPGSRGSIPLGRARVVEVPQAAGVLDQARALLLACRAMARAGSSGVFLTSGYPYLDFLTINLLRSPFVPLPVVHGTYPGVIEWVTVGPPRRIVAVSRRFAPRLEADLRARVGFLRSFARIEVIPNGVPLPPAGAVARKLSSFPAPPFRIVAVTRLDSDLKRPYDYLALAEYIREQGLPFRLTIMGGGPLEERMRVRVRDRDLKGLVTLTGNVTREAVYAELLRSDLFILTSESEASSLAVNEALACGCAAIARAESLDPAIIKARAAFAVEPVEGMDFVAALHMFAGDPDRIRSLAVRGRRFAEDHLSADKMVERYAILIRRLARHGRVDATWSPPDPPRTSSSALPSRLTDRLLNFATGVIESFTT